MKDEAVAKKSTKKIPQPSEGEVQQPKQQLDKPAHGDKDTPPPALPLTNEQKRAKAAREYADAQEALDKTTNELRGAEIRAAAVTSKLKKLRASHKHLTKLCADALTELRIRLK
jgi:hypothetical protein